ncbi:hypothetical protein IFM89_034981 [Coptis chinensis]|uniref:Uncharacterized protein n=1 Tax=Coptis chinensis TaxID=261450 RepID=A0A835ISG3_9MAGN|nr:hypothetical protein IFM89_034981 [Coptis chinensis]
MGSSSNQVRKCKPAQHQLLSFSTHFLLLYRDREFFKHKHFHRQRQPPVLFTASNSNWRSKECSNNFKNLEFQKVSWDLQQLHNLCTLLEKNMNVKQIRVPEKQISESLEELQIWEDSIGSRGAEELSKMIEVNSTLKMLIVLDSNSITAGPLISTVLARNRTMEIHVWSGGNGEKSSKVVEFEPGNSALRIYKLDLFGLLQGRLCIGVEYDCQISRYDRNQIEVQVGKGIQMGFRTESKPQRGVEHLLCPLSRFSALQNQANTTLKSVTFGGGRTKVGRDGLVAILQMLITNQSLVRLGIYDDKSLGQEDFIRIFRSLENNATLRYLSLQGCKGVQGDLMVKTIMETLQINPYIEDIDLTRTPLQSSGKTEGIYQKLGQNGRIEPEMDLLKDMPLAMPKSCRVFLCGQEFAGKSTLCNSIWQNFSPKLPYLDQVRTLVHPVEQAVRTVGIKIKTFKDGDTKISIWDLAGQHEFYTLHDLMFPGPQAMLPSVTVVLTHFDKITQSSDSFQITIRLIRSLRERFQGFVEFYSTVFTVDARSSGSVSKLTHHVRKSSKTILQRVPHVYELCNELIQFLADWRSENHSKPAMRWKDFCELCQVKITALRIRSRHDNLEKVELRRRAIANSLHHIGEVIYFQDLGFLILDCEWFCRDVLGPLVSLDIRRYSTMEKNGFMSKTDLEKILTGNLQSQIPGMGSKIFDNLQVSDLVRMMLKLELCYEQNLGDPNSLLLIPSLLEEGRGRSQRWQISMTDCVYSGRHLECDDSSHMFLTPGFFPKLQVHLHNKIFGSKNQHVATYGLEKYLITITINGIYIRVELGGQLGHYIDVLACSTKNLTEILRLFQQLIIPTIQNLCHGVTLRESILRPECVKNLTAPRYRKTQFVPLQQLKQSVLSVPADSMYDYQHTWGPVSDGGRPILQSGFDFARDLLSDDDFREVLHRRYNDLYHLAVELAVPLENSPDGPDQLTQVQDEADSAVEPTFDGIAKGVEAVLQRLKIIEQEIRDLKMEIQGLRYYEHRLLTELHYKVNYLVNFNVQIEERKKYQTCSILSRQRTIRGDW